MLNAFVNTAQSPKTPADWKRDKVSDLSKKTQQHWHHPIDRKHTFLHAKFKVGSLFLVREKASSTKRDTFPWDGPSISSNGGV
jgi:hypothetical protein